VTTTTYDEETVRLMISVALETQKQTLFEPFIEEHIAVLQEHRQALTTLQQEAAAAALHYRHFTYVS
jgi:predicted anti-sigma-YlaC factor YlaD